MAEKASEFAVGTVVWARCEGWPWWPGMIVPFSITSFLPEKGFTPANDASKYCVQYFCNGTVSLLRSVDLVRFEEGMHHLENGGRYDEVIRKAALGAQGWIQQHCQYARTEVASEIDGLRKKLGKELGLLEQAKAEFETIQCEIRTLKMMLENRKARDRETSQSSVVAERPLISADGKPLAAEEQTEVINHEYSEASEVPLGAEPAKVLVQENDEEYVMYLGEMNEISEYKEYEDSESDNEAIVEADGILNEIMDFEELVENIENAEERSEMLSKESKDQKSMNPEFEIPVSNNVLDVYVVDSMQLIEMRGYGDMEESATGKTKEADNTKELEKEMKDMKKAEHEEISNEIGQNGLSEDLRDFLGLINPAALAKREAALQ